MVIFIPTAWNLLTDINGEEEKFDLHDYIKAYAAQKQIATQFIREDTLSDPLACQVNWWLSLSFYVKSQRTPWILNSLPSDTAFVGIGYSVNHRARGNKVVLGCSHIYNSTGQGLRYKLSRIEDCSFDRRNNPYLSYSEAYKFGAMIRELFFNAIGDLPKRVVVHKRTQFKRDEVNGIVDSLKKSGIQQVDLIEINFEDNARFVSLYTKDGNINPQMFPLSRGSSFLLDRSTALLWTHGIVPSVKADNRSYYLGGKNIPIPLKVKKHYGSSNIGTVANEILGLTKMNWNSFDLYAKLPSTIQTSNEIARIGWLLNRFEGKTYDYRNFM
jgi:argonaute-like protein implicated in RNA metabolism and viral defense